MEDDFEFEGERGELSLHVHMIAGSFAGLMEHVVLFPVDTIKTHLQANSHIKSVNKIISLLYLEGGVLRFWRGSSVVATGCIPAHAAYFSVYELTKKKLGVEKSGFQFVAAGITGILSTFIHDFILTPYDVIKQRMQLSGLKRCLHCMKSVIKSEGILALYRSLPITMIMNAPYAVTTVTVNENMKKIVEPKKRKFKFLSYFYCAAFAGATASFVTCPLDNIKTKLQTQSTVSSCEQKEFMINQIKQEIKNDMKNNKLSNNINNEINEVKLNNYETCGNKKNIVKEYNKYCKNNNKDINYKNTVKYTSISDTAKAIYINDGFFKGFFKGIGPRILFNAPSCAISWASYEIMKHLLSSSYL